MKVTLITVALNSAATILNTLESVALQDYKHIEHIVIDGGSTDETLSLVRSFPHVSIIISEPDNGIYDAINKGILLATGHIVGILNSDDFYPNTQVISKVVQSFRQQKCEATIGDVEFVDPKNLERKTRHYSAENWDASQFANGFMPPHPAFFVKRKHYKNFGLYKTNYAIAGDFELLLRFLNKKALNYFYIPEALVTMRTGGISNRSLKNRLILNKEIIKACGENAIQTSYSRIGMRYFKKMPELNLIASLSVFFRTQFFPNMPVKPNPVLARRIKVHSPNLHKSKVESILQAQ